MAFKRVGTVRIMHSGCSRLILALPAFSRTGTPAPDTKTLAASDAAHRFALDACRVVTNDAAKDKGYLSKDLAGHDRVAPSRDDLPPGEYFYHLGPPSTTPSTNYPIVTDFAAWKFPRDIPHHWRQRQPSTEEYEQLERRYDWCSPRDMRPVVMFEDDGCVLTRARQNICFVVHLVPSCWQERWFLRNRVTPYTWGSETGLEDPANGVTLRVDLAKIYNWNGFVFFPDGEGGYAGYVCLPMYEEYEDLLHGKRAVISPRVNDEFLYARFGYTIIALAARNPGLKAFPLPKGVKPSKKRGEQHRDSEHMRGRLTSSLFATMYI